jgi:hypothetical protein
MEHKRSLWSVHGDSVSVEWNAAPDYGNVSWVLRQETSSIFL